ncbi:MAG: HYR domain-containing protein [Bacteroidia bacterium]
MTSAPLGQTNATVTFTEPIGTDNCANATTVLGSGIANGGVFLIGTTTETYIVHGQRQYCGL